MDFLVYGTEKYFPNSKWLTLALKQKSKDILLHNWYTQKNKSLLYSCLKPAFSLNQCIHTLPKILSIGLILLITRNHHLPIGTGRWNSIPENDRICNVCNEIGDKTMLF